MTTTPKMTLRAIHDLAAYRLRIETDIGDIYLRPDRVEVIFSKEMKDPVAIRENRESLLSVHVLTYSGNTLDLSMTAAQLQGLRQKCGFLDPKL
jgi:hypothetical protein